MGNISNRSLRSESSDVIINFFDDFSRKLDRLKTQSHLKFQINSLVGPKTIFQTHLKVKSVKTRIQKSWKV